MQMSIARASLIMIVTLAASRVLGWLRLSVIGAQFGGDARELDAFWAAFRIPDTIFNLLVAGAPKVNLGETLGWPLAIVGTIGLLAVWYLFATWWETRPAPLPRLSTARRTAPAKHSVESLRA